MKNLNQKGFTHHIVVLGLSAVVIGAIGFTGYRVYKNHSVNAKAEVPDLLVDRSTIAAPVTWVDALGTDKPAVKTNGPVNYGYYASREVLTTTNVSTLSAMGRLLPNNISATSSPTYLYNGDMLFVDHKYTAPAMSRILSTKSNSLTKVGVLKEFTGGINVEAVCAGNNYVAYVTSGSDANSALWVANYDFSQTRKVIDVATLKAQAVEGTTYHAITEISCGDNYAYFSDNNRTIYKVPFLTKRPDLKRLERVGSAASFIRLADYSKLASLPAHTRMNSHLNGGAQYQRDNQILLLDTTSTMSTNLVLFDATTNVVKVVKPLSADVDPSYGMSGYVSLSPDGLKIAYSHSTQGVKIWDIATAKIEKTVMPNPKVSSQVFVFGWKPVQ